MDTAPNTLVSTGKVVERAKARQLDVDRSITLTPEVAQLFADRMNEQFATANAGKLLPEARAQQLSTLITADLVFPFVADIQDGRLRLMPSLMKTEDQPVLKNISDGVTEINKKFAQMAQLSEPAKFAIAMLFQPALRDAYCNAGMSEGPHTRYFYRSC